MLHAGIVAGPEGSWDDWAASRILAAQDRIGVADFLAVLPAYIPVCCVRCTMWARDRIVYLALPLPISGIIALYQSAWVNVSALPVCLSARTIVRVHMMTHRTSIPVVGTTYTSGGAEP